jgi:putative component of membrane protein insertase Oxa1/YidC/SpoIIIJ protein YidD
MNHLKRFFPFREKPFIIFYGKIFLELDCPFRLLESPDFGRKCRFYPLISLYA